MLSWSTFVLCCTTIDRVLLKPAIFPANVDVSSRFHIGFIMFHTPKCCQKQPQLLQFGSLIFVPSYTIFPRIKNWFLAWQFESESLYTKMPFRASHHQQITNHRHHWQGVAFFSAPQACWDVEIDSLDVAPLLHPHLPSRGGWKSCTQIASPRLNQIKEMLFQSPGEWVDLVTRCLSGRRAMMTIYLLVWTHLVQPTKTYSIAKQGWSYQVLIQLDNAWNHKPNEI